MREITHDRVKAPSLSEPTGPEADGPVEGAARLFECTIVKCRGRRFKKAMIAARHFNTTHSDLAADKDSWREHVKEVLE